MHREYFLLLCLSVFNLFCCVQCCSFIQNVEMEVVPKTGQAFNVTVNSCIERTTFNTTIKKVYVREQNIPHLNKGTVQNMVRLQLVSFDRCFTETVEPGAFRNVPRLLEIILIFSNIKKISKGVFNGLPALDIVRINNNKIDVIEDESFANIPTLRKIFAKNNKLEYWNPKWFTNSTALVAMDFSHNLIHKIPTKAFQYLTNMSEIYLDYNEISEIEPGAFNGIQSLKYLGLKHNRLTTIEPDIFSKGLKIESLMIDANKLNFLTLEVLNKVSGGRITFDGNPWKCSCLENILFWVNQKNVTVQNSPYCSFNNIPVCVFPETYSNTCLEIVDKDVTETYLIKVRDATKDNANFVSNKCVRFN